MDGEKRIVHERIGRNIPVTAREPSSGYDERRSDCAIVILQISQNSTVVGCTALLSNGKEVEFPPLNDD